MDIFPTSMNTPNLHEQFAVPQGIFDNDGETEGVCHTFIYNAMMPAYEASMWGAKKGKSHNVVAWFTLNEWVKKQLRGEEKECAAVSQLREWSKHGDPMHKQFKTIVRVSNPDILDAGFTVRKLIDQVSHLVRNRLRLFVRSSPHCPLHPYHHRPSSCQRLSVQRKAFPVQRHPQDGQGWEYPSVEFRRSHFLLSCAEDIF